MFPQGRAAALVRLLREVFVAHALEEVDGLLHLAHAVHAVFDADPAVVARGESMLKILS